jgi:hypothetical protein
MNPSPAARVVPARVASSATKPIAAGYARNQGL